MNCIVREHMQPKVVLPLLRVYSNKWRLVLDASRELNPYCRRRGVKVDDLIHVKNILKQNDWMKVNDLDYGYWHVPVHKDSWQYLGVHFIEDDGSVSFWTWRVLVLGIIDATHIFTRLLSPILTRLRREGMRCLIYIDDLFLTAATKQLAIEHSKQAFVLFAKCGWTFNRSGLNIDSKDLTFNIQDDKLNAISKKLKYLEKRDWVHVKLLAKVVGTLQSLRLATGPLIAVKTRSLYYIIATAPSWSSHNLTSSWTTWARPRSHGGTSTSTTSRSI